MAIPDLALLGELSVESILSVLQERYKKDDIYTYVGDILIAVNPYKILPIVAPEVQAKYLRCQRADHDPHIYYLAYNAYETMLRTRQNQAFVISGESGSGKTESTKLVVNHVIELCKASNKELESRITQLNPLIEAFGNAKTVMNNNSSRFGKFLDLKFDRTGAVTGAEISEYLLEKSRVTSQAPGEQNYHIFYILLAAAGIDKGFGLGKPSEHPYVVSEGGPADGELLTEENAAAMPHLLSTFGKMGFDPKDVDSMQRVLAALLHIGNVQFGSDKDDFAMIAGDAAPLQRVAELLKVDPAGLQAALLSTTTQAGGEMMTRKYTADVARETRDSLARALYARMFGWLITCCNTNLADGSETATYDHSLGILDIFGFEDFAVNQLEQLCINITNEQLQFFFNQHIFAMEQKEYAAEGIDVAAIDFVDNQPTLDMLLGKPRGVLAMLDEESRFPKATDLTYTRRVATDLGPHKSEAFKPPQSDKDLYFSVVHYAGAVKYTTDGFLNKNRDALPQDVVAALRFSEDDLIGSLWAARKTGTGTFRTVRAARDAHATSKRKAPATVGSQFSNSLEDLMRRISESNPHFIRCIKPNEVQRPMILEPTSVMTQLRYSGMCAALVLMQAGFPTRVSFQELYDRYKPHMPRQMLGLKPITFCEAILVALDLDGGRDFQMGLTKVFFRPGKLAQMNDALVSSDPADVDIVVRKVRLWLARKRFFAAGWSIVALNRIMDNVERHRYFKRFRTFANVVVRLQRCVKPWIARVRKRLYDDGALAKRREEERILAEKRAAEEARRAEEERKRKEQAERKRQEEEAEKQRKIEEEKRKREEAWQSMVDKLAALTESNTQLQSQLDSAVARQTDIQGKLDNETDRRSKGEVDLGSAKQALESAEGKLVAMEQRYSDAVAEAEARLDAERKGHSARLTEFAQAAEGDQAQLMAKMQTAMEEKSAADEAKLVATEAELKTQRDVSDALTSDLASLQTRFDALTASKNAENEAASAALAALQETLGTTKSTLEGSLAKLTTELEEEGHALNDTRAQLSLAQLAVMDLEADGEELRTTVARLETQLAEAMASHDSVSAELQSERHAREDQVHTLESNLAEAKKQAANDGEVKDALSAALKLELQATQEKLESEKARSSAALKALAAGKSDVEEELHETTEALREAERVSTARATEIARLEGVVEQLQHERRVLQDKAADGLLSAAKLRTMFDSYYKGGKMDTELLVRLHGSASFETLAVKATKLSKVEKQGGQNEKKWETRLFVLIDNFLVYYGSEKDKTPKGAVRLDKSHVELCDLSKVNRQHGIRVTDPRNQRTLTFAASSAEEQLVWKAVLEAGGLTL
mmetsp:Transcript_10812/g.32376  ORF Transcript_10812/g.32376 Transcript_10812/m.32376 type:complete len:1341 (-) Transcript_10812:72-4094(-)